MGNDEEVEIEDDIAIGVLERIIKETVPPNTVQFNVEMDKRQGSDVGLDFGIDISKVDIVKYRRMMVLACVMKAPWEIHDEATYNQLPQSVAAVLTSKIMEIYPPIDFLMSFIESMTGGTKASKPKVNVKKSQKPLKA